MDICHFFHYYKCILNRKEYTALFKSKLQFWTLEILLIVAIIYILTKISFLFDPVVVFMSTLFFPLLIAGFLYFLFNPLVSIVHNKLKVPRTIGIIILYLLFIGLLVFLIATVVPIITRQIKELINDIPFFINEIQLFIEEVIHSEAFHWVQTQQYVEIDQIMNSLSSYLTAIPSTITGSISGLFGVITNMAVVVVTVPFLLFFLLKDGHKLPNAIMRFIPSSYRKEGLLILKDTTDTLAAYIQGQMIVSLCVGTLSYIGYLIIGLDYALILAIAVALTNIIPYLGPILGAAPAVIVAMFESPLMVGLVIIVAVIAQQIESNLISPLVIGKRLDTHPATIIIILLVAGNLAGVLGMILGVPVYAVCKTIVLNIVRLIKLHRNYKKELEAEAPKEI